MCPRPSHLSYKKKKALDLEEKTRNTRMKHVEAVNCYSSRITLRDMSLQMPYGCD